MHDDDEGKALALRQAALPAVLDAHALIGIARFLRERIPGFQCLSLEEERAMLRASNLDAEFIEGSLSAAAASPEAQRWAGMPVEEMRTLDAEIRESDRLEQELTVLLRGIAGANRKRKYRLGRAAFRIYKYLGVALKGPYAAEESHLRPYYEEMQRAYMKNRKPRGKARPKSPPPPDTADGSRG